jgi:hypothetical protein
MLGGSAAALVVLDCNVDLICVERDFYPRLPALARQAMGQASDRAARA